MKYRVIFEVDEQQLLDLADDNGDLTLTPQALFIQELGWLEQSGIYAIDIKPVNPTTEGEVNNQ